MMTGKHSDFLLSSIGLTVLHLVANLSTSRRQVVFVLLVPSLEQVTRFVARLFYRYKTNTVII